MKKVLFMALASMIVINFFIIVFVWLLIFIFVNYIRKGTNN